MAKIKVYSPEGKAVLLEPVDAREVVEHNGYTYEPRELEEFDLGTEAPKANKSKSK